ncbi:MAG: NeuD/PglB/VioB family sugar acetyltransferase [Planctomycetales bacterium]
MLEVRDDNETSWGKTLCGVPIAGPIGDAAEDLPAVIAIGDNAVRMRIAKELDLEWKAVVHPRAFVDSTAKVGPGTVVFANGAVQADAIIGAAGIVNTSSSIDHDCRLGPFCHVAPGVHLCGNVTLGEGVLMGVGSVAVPGVQVGEWSVVGAGSAVIRDLPAGCTAWGVPAAPRK